MKAKNSKGVSMAKKLPTQAEVRKALHRWYLAVVNRDLYPRSASRNVEYIRAHCALREIVRRQREPGVMRSMRRLSQNGSERS